MVLLLRMVLLLSIVLLLRMVLSRGVYGTSILSVVAMLTVVVPYVLVIEK